MKITLKIKPTSINEVYNRFTFCELTIIKTNIELRMNIIILNLSLSLIIKSF